MDDNAWDERYREKPLLWGAEPNRLFSEIATPLKPGRALDLAAGEGRNAVWLAQRGWDVVAVDFSSVALDRGEALAGRAGVEVSFERADLQNYEPDSSAFDLVLILYLHVPAELRRLIYTRATRSLVPGGTMVVIGHDVRNLEEGVGGPQEPAILLSPETVVGELDGCDAIRAETVLRSVDGQDREALDTVVVARRADR